MLKILQADDHPLFREGVSGFLAQLDPEVQIFQAASLGETLELVERQPDLDLVLLDLMMPGMEGFAGFAEIEKRNHSVPIVVISALETSYDINQAIAAGASGYIPKSYQPRQMLDALRQVLAGELYKPGGDNHAKPPVDLTERQWQVLALLTSGHSNREIGDRLFISERTVKHHVAAIFKQLGVETRGQALAKLHEFGYQGRP